MFEKVRSIIVKNTLLEENQIKEDSLLRADLEISSLDIVSIAMDFEDEFNIEIPDRDIYKFAAVSDIVKYLEEHALN